MCGFAAPTGPDISKVFTTEVITVSLSKAASDFHYVILWCLYEATATEANFWSLPVRASVYDWLDKLWNTVAVERCLHKADTHWNHPPDFSGFAVRTQQLLDSCLAAKVKFRHLAEWARSCVVCNFPTMLSEQHLLHSVNFSCFAWNGWNLLDTLQTRNTTIAVPIPAQ